MRADLELVTRRLVDVRGAQQIEALLARRQRHGAAYDGAGPLCCVHDIEGRLVDQPIVERCETDTDSLALHFFIDYSMIFATAPGPTVLPPSRMAKRRP